jgi:hypothetical protein
MKEYEQFPHGLVVYHPPSSAFNFGAALAKEGAPNLLEGFYEKGHSRQAPFPAFSLVRAMR